MIDRSDQIAGVIYGLAAGDRVGGPLNMALTLAWGLADRGRFDLESISRRYFEWWRGDGFDTGPTAARVFRHVASGCTFETAAKIVHESSGEMTAGCNPAHRSAPLAMFLKIDDDDLAQSAIAEARLTHLHPLAGDVSAAVVRLCRALIRGQSWPEALHFASIGRLAETCQALKIDDSPPNSPGGFAPEVLAAAIRFIDRSDSFETAMSQALEHDSGANYVPVLVGSIGGARWGRAAIPAHYLESRHELNQHLDNLLRLLARCNTIVR